MIDRSTFLFLLFLFSFLLLLRPGRRRPGLARAPPHPTGRRRQQQQQQPQAPHDLAPSCFCCRRSRGRWALHLPRRPPREVLLARRLFPRAGVSARSGRGQGGKRTRRRRRQRSLPRVAGGPAGGRRCLRRGPRERKRRRRRFRRRRRDRHRPERPDGDLDRGAAAAREDEDQGKDLRPPAGPPPHREDHLLRDPAALQPCRFPEDPLTAC